MKDTPTLDCLRRRADMQKSIAGRGIFAALRQERGLPAAPGQMTVNGTAVNADCDFVVLRYNQLPGLSPEMVKAYQTTEYKDKFRKCFFYQFAPPPVSSGLKLETSYGNGVFYMYYDRDGKPQDMPVNTDYLPGIYRFQSRMSTIDNTKNSYLGIEPGVTIIILP